MRFILTICLATLAAANIEFKHHNNTELAAILQQVNQIFNIEKRPSNLELQTMNYGCFEIFSVNSCCFNKNHSRISYCLV